LPIAFAAGDLWLRIDTIGHTSGEDFLLYLALVVFVGLTIAAIRIHIDKRRAQGD
jgi:hypothetical protein